MGKVVKAALVVAVVGALGWLVASKLVLTPLTTRVEFDGMTVTAGIADTPEERRQGLSGRTDLAENQGLLFVFDEPGFYHFHMKDMQFPIDIIWLDENFEVVDVTQRLDPNTYPETVTSFYPAQFVLEVNAGFADRYDIGIGDQVQVGAISRSFLLQGPTL